MTANELFTIIAQISGLLGIVCSMLAMGLGLTVSQIVQPLKNARLVVLALLANFVLVPLLAYVITLIIPLEESLKIGLIVLACCAGAPFLILEAKGAKANLAVAVGVMTLLMVVTIFYLPVVLPLLLHGVEVDAGAIAQSLIVLMLIPLILGLLVKAHAPDTAKNWAPTMNKIGSLGILILLVVGLGLNVANVISLIGTRWFPGAAALHRRQSCDRFCGWRPRPRHPQCDGVGHRAAQCVGCYSHYAAKLCGHECSPVCAGGGYPAPVDPNLNRTLAGRAQRGRSAPAEAPATPPAS